MTSKRFRFAVMIMSTALTMTLSATAAWACVSNPSHTSYVDSARGWYGGSTSAYNSATDMTDYEAYTSSDYSTIVQATVYAYDECVNSSFTSCTSNFSDQKSTSVNGYYASAKVSLPLGECGSLNGYHLYVAKGVHTFNVTTTGYSMDY